MFFYTWAFGLSRLCDSDSWVNILKSLELEMLCVTLKEVEGALSFDEFISSQLSVSAFNGELVICGAVLFLIFLELFVFFL